MYDDVGSTTTCGRQRHGRVTVRASEPTTTQSRGMPALCSNYTYSICCGFVVQLVVQQIHNKSKCLQQIHNKSKVVQHFAQTPLIRFVVDLLYNLLYNKSTTQSLNAAVFEKVNQLVPSFTLCTTVCNGWLWRSTASLSVIVLSCNFSQPVSSPKASSLACRWRLCRRSASWCFSAHQHCASILG